MAPLLNKHYQNEGSLSEEKVPKKCFQTLFRRPSQLRWGASNSLNIGGVEGGEISFLSIASDLEALESIENQ